LTAGIGFANARLLEEVAVLVNGRRRKVARHRQCGRSLNTAGHPFFVYLLYIDGYISKFDPISAKFVVIKSSASG
jgi:hypothetical protein